MPDINCRICAEPWDLYGTHHGDMLRWEAILLFQGAGCPSCAGESPFETPPAIEQVAGATDPVEEAEEAFLGSMLRADRHLPQLGKTPKWKEPPAPVVWECAGCNVKVVRDPTSDYPDGDLHSEVGGELLWSGGDPVHYIYGRAYSYGNSPAEDPTEKPHAVFQGLPYCPGCIDRCDNCGEMIFKRSELWGDDSYNPGSSFPHPDNCRYAVCLDCYQELTAEDEE
jgi:hypothetical protein